MTREHLTSERINELAIRLALLGSRRTIEDADDQIKQLEQVLLFHLRSCQPLRILARLLLAALSGRFLNCAALIGEQRALVQLAADESSQNASVLEAIAVLSKAVIRFELGRDASERHRIAYAACNIPTVRIRFAQMVRRGDIAFNRTGLTLLRARRRRLAAYGFVSALAAGPGSVFITMAISGTIGLADLCLYLVSSILMAAYLTRGNFADLREDERVIRDLNSRPRLRLAKQQRSDC